MVENAISSMDALYNPEGHFKSWIRDENNAEMAGLHLSRVISDYSIHQLIPGFLWMVNGWQPNSIAILVYKACYYWSPEMTARLVQDLILQVETLSQVAIHLSLKFPTLKHRIIFQKHLLAGKSFSFVSQFFLLTPNDLLPHTERLEILRNAASEPSSSHLPVFPVCQQQELAWLDPVVRVSKRLDALHLLQ